jgi:L-asparaginase II
MRWELAADMNPVLVNIWRGNAIENHHRGAVSVIDSSGRPVLAIGDVQRPVFPRSAIKFLQAIPFVESGAIEHYSLKDQHIAIACASHNGEPLHVELVEDWLQSIQCDHDDLECGAQLPLHQATQFELMQQGRGPQRTHHDCSGKHLGMLSTCKHLGENTLNYRLYNHSAQRRWFDVLENLSNSRAMQLPWGYDGCGIPTLALPLQRIAIAMARFGDASNMSTERRAAVERIQAAVTRHPYLVAGKERSCTAIMERLAPQVLVKVGAQGVYTASLPESGLGVALKIDDGNDSAARVVLGAVLQHLGVIDVHTVKELEEYIAPSMTNSRGDVIGRAEPSSEWQTMAPLG